MQHRSAVWAGLTALVLLASPALADPPAAAGVIVTSVTAGLVDPNGKVPAINAVPGAGVDNADLTFPRGILVHGVPYDFQITSQNTTGSGKCKTSYKLEQVQSGHNVTLMSGTTAAYNCAVGTVWLWSLVGNAIPNSPGAATLTGTVTIGKKKSSLTVPVVIQ